jgi:hypothetical protein
MLFSAAPAPAPAPSLAPSALKSLWLSLNAPVVAIDDLPVGAARAAIALHQGAGEGFRLTVAVRLVRTGQVLFFTPDEEVSGACGSAPDLDAAMSFAEAMGFLFDDDEVEARGDADSGEAARLWYELIGEPDAEEGTGEGVAPGQGVEPRSLTKFRPWATGIPSDPPASAGRCAGGPEGEPAREGGGASPQTEAIPGREAWRGAW